MVDAPVPEPLGAVACRVLGCLLEKEVTVPATYPMTLNAVVSAANQTSGRDPVMSIDERTAEAALDELRLAGYVRRVHASHGARVEKYRHVAGERLEVDHPALALIAVLLLRGAQTPGELRGRSERLHPFDSVDEVAAELAALAGRDGPLVVELARRPGRKEQRWAHLLAGPVSDEPDAAASPSPPAAAAPEPIVIEPQVAALAPFAGRWAGEGAGEYPTIEPFGYREEIDLLPVPGKPFLSYRSATRHADDGRILHGETGFLRCTPDGSLELVLAAGPGLVEICEGIVDDGELLLASTLVGMSSTAKSVTATERRYRVERDGEADVLTYEIAMAAVGQPLTHHLHARLRRR